MRGALVAVLSTPLWGSQADTESWNGGAKHFVVARVRELYLVYQEHGDPWDWSKDLRAQTLFDEHARFLDALVEGGVVVLGGPVDERDVLLVVDAPTPDSVRTHFADDPWIKNGMVTITAIRPWKILLDGRSSPG